MNRKFRKLYNEKRERKEKNQSHFQNLNGQESQPKASLKNNIREVVHRCFE